MAPSASTKRRSPTTPTLKRDQREIAAASTLNTCPGAIRIFDGGSAAFGAADVDQRFQVGLAIEDLGKSGSSRVALA